MFYGIVADRSHTGLRCTADRLSAVTRGLLSSPLLSSPLLSSPSVSGVSERASGGGGHVSGAELLNWVLLCLRVFTVIYFLIHLLHEEVSFVSS